MSYIYNHCCGPVARGGPAGLYYRVYDRRHLQMTTTSAARPKKRPSQQQQQQAKVVQYGNFSIWHHDEWSSVKLSNDGSTLCVYWACFSVLELISSGPRLCVKAARNAALLCMPSSHATFLVL